MKLAAKLSIAFSVAAAFLLVVGVVAVLVMNRFDAILNQTTYYNQQAGQVNMALRAVRLSPERTSEHLARLDDLMRWARTEQEREMLQAARTALTRDGSVAEEASWLEQLASSYSRATENAHADLLRLHNRTVIGIIVIMINSVLLFVFLTWLVRHWLLNPVSDLGESIAVLADGQLDHKIKSTAGAEFDRIAASLNTLVEKLRDYEQRAVSAEKYAVVGQACAHVTHNVRSLLDSIRSLAQHESNASAAGADSRVGFNYIIASVNKLDGWVRGLHASLAPHNPNSSPHQIEPVIHDALSLLQPRLHERHLRIDYRAPDELPEVVMDRTLFEQAFVAILTNAIEASPDDACIGVHLQNGDTGHVTVEIHDEGAGMTEVTRAHAFEAFFTTKPENTGLGLTVARSIIQRHGGQIKIESGAERGTRVTIQLPAHPASRSAPSASTHR